MGYPEGWLELNQAIDRCANPIFLNEREIEKSLKRLETRKDSADPVYWLTLARLFELSLYLAGNYADHGEFSAAGDLVVNPRKVLIHMDQVETPILKRRHSRISDQVMESAGGRETNLGELLLHQTISQVVEEPLLPSLFKRMETSGKFKQDYVLSGKKRMSRVAVSMGFVFSCRLKKETSVEEYARTLDRESRQDLESNLCRFDLSLFWNMKRQIGFHLDREEKAKQVFQGRNRLCEDSVTA